MDPTDILLRSVDQTGKIVAGVKPDQLSLSTPCTEFDVKTLLNHTVGALKMFLAGARGEQLDMGAFSQDLVGDDPAGAYDKTAAEFREALGQPGVLEKTWNMPFGQLPGMMCAGIGTVEFVQHGWDIAKATGQQADFDPELTEAAFTTARMMPAEQVRNANVYGPEVEAPPDAPAHDRLAAFLGRTL
jgi:uncharacterized protein (TIGR03086 family)